MFSGRASQLRGDIGIRVQSRAYGDRRYASLVG